MMIFFARHALGACDNCNLSQGYECCGNKCYELVKYYRCCGNDYCLSDYCYESTDYDYNVTKCTSQYQYDMCLTPYGFSFIFGIIVIPTIITFIISFSCCKERAPKISFLVDILTSLWIATLVHYISCIDLLLWVNYYFIYIIYYFIFLILYRCNVFRGGTGQCKSGQCKGVANMHEPEECSQMAAQCCAKCGCACCSECWGRCWRCEWCDYPEAPLAVAMELASEPMSMSELASVVNSNAVLPPDVMVTGECFNNLMVEKRKEVIGRGERRIAYGSWQEEGRPIYLPRRPLVRYRCEVTFEYDGEVRSRVENAETELRSQFEGRGEYVRVADSTTVPYLAEFAVATEGRGCCVSCMRSCPVRAFYTLLFFIGYHSVFEAIWRGLGSTVVFRSRKVISAGRGLRAEPYQRDERAANMVRLDMPPEIIAPSVHEESLLN